MKERRWTELVTSLQYGRCILVLGPEIPVCYSNSMNENNNNLQGNASESLQTVNGNRENFQVSARDLFKKHLSKELENDGRKIQENHFRAVAQQYEDDRDFGAESLRAEAAAFYGEDHFKPSEIHELLAELPFILTISTNHDRLFDNALKGKGKTPDIAFYNFRGNLLDNVNPVIPKDPNSPLIYNLFGHINNPISLVLNENDLADFLIAVVDKNPPLPDSIIKAMKKGSTLLFIGFGLKHWYLRVLLKIFLRALELHLKGSKIVTEPLSNLDDLDLQKTIYFYKRGVRIHVNDSELLPFINELRKRLVKKGGFTPQTAAFTSSPKVFISYASQDNDIATQLYSSLSDSGFDPWIDKEALEAGDSWDNEINNGIKESDFILIICSKALKDKMDSYVNKEIALSIERSKEVRGKFIIPVQTDDIQAGEIRPEFSEIQAVKISVDYNGEIDKLISTLKREYQRRKR